MNQSRRFVVVSFFVTLTLSAVCQACYGIIEDIYRNAWTVNLLFDLVYGIGFASFLIKYFIDDVVDDNGGVNEPVSRRGLSSLIIGWMMFLVAALFVRIVWLSSLIWFLGICVISLFMIRNKSQISDSDFRLYLTENICLAFFLVLPTASRIFSGFAVIDWISKIGVLVVAMWSFKKMLADDTPSSV